MIDQTDSFSFSGIFEAGIEPIPLKPLHECIIPPPEEAAGLRRGDRFSTFTHSTLKTLPFKLGETAAELKVPYSFSDEIENNIASVIDTMIKLISARVAGLSDNESKKEENRSLIRNLSQRCLGWNAGFRLLLYGDIWNGAMVDKLLDSRGQGRALINGLLSLYNRMAEEDIKAGKGYTPYLFATHLAMIHTTKTIKDSFIKTLTVKGLNYEKLDRIISISLWSLLTSFIERFIFECERKKLPLPLNRLASWLFGMTSIRILLTVERSLEKSGGGPFELPVPALREILSLVATSQERTLSNQQFYNSLEKNEDLFFYTLYFHLRRKIIYLYSILTIPTPKGVDFNLESIAYDESALRELLKSLKLASKWASGMKEFTETGRFSKLSPSGQMTLLSIVDMLESIGKNRMSILRERFANDVALKDNITALAEAEALDNERYSELKLLLNLIEDRRRTQDLERLNVDYEGGRLYRFANDELPIICTTTTEKCGQLFIDLKSFTKRTERAKEVVIADFLEREFYTPILKASAKYVGEVPQPTTMQLNNLLGDAALFSGSVKNLIALAQDIQEIARNYEEKLNSVVPLASLDSELGTIERRMMEQQKKLNEEETDLSSNIKELQQKIQKALSQPKEELMKRFKENTNNSLLKLQQRLQSLSNQEDKEREAIVAQAKLTKERYKKIIEDAGNIGETDYKKLLIEKLFPQEITQLRTLNERMSELKSEREELRAYFESEKEAVRGYGLKLGLFISYGGVPTIIKLNSPPWEGVTVAIGEKINEAARGTARTISVLNHINAMLEIAKQKNNNSRLELPFSTYIEESYDLKIPLELYLKLEQVVSQKSNTAIQELAAAFTQLISKDIETVSSSEGGATSIIELESAIYNEGECLSGEALDNYLSETVGERMHAHKTIVVSELPTELTSRFFFYRPTMNFIISLSREKPYENPMMFRFVGKIRFRGFERKEPTLVFQLLRPSQQFYQAFMNWCGKETIDELLSDHSLQISSINNLPF